ncbi:MAG TPA: phosphoglucosamine mutase [Oscillospiraceae bacterium]|nr:phosphoglucosamine mutase [Oscillospiraceae bacterium]
MGVLFGTDGIRGVANEEMTAEMAYRVGQAAAIVLTEEKHGRALFTIGKDTRISGDMLESALIAGLCACGADVLHLGVIPTPAVAYLTVHEKADAGVVISASHNPFEHNGIKIFSGEGYKLSDALEERIETLILSGEPLPIKTKGDIGRVLYGDRQESRRYIEHLISTVKTPISGLRIAVDCANGAATTTAAELFGAFPLDVDLYNATPDGVNINAGCGSTHLEGLCAVVREGGYDLGVAFDGDADRCLIVDETGKELDGDVIMGVCALALREEGALPGDTIVATVMSNIGLHLFAKEHGLTLLCTDVGDRYVLERMLEGGFVLGGEQSGHLIFRNHATTGDGQLAALQFLQILCASGRTASQIAAAVPRYPQVQVNVAVPDNAAKQRIKASEALSEAVRRAEAELPGGGRILVRPSGTESLIRVMVEAVSAEDAKNCAEKLANFVKTL